jgi:hypothetical protein
MIELTAFWVFWFGLVALLASAWMAAYAWNASKLGLLKKEKAETFWRISSAAFTAGILLAGYAFTELFGARIANGAPRSFTEFWLATAACLAGFALCCTKAEKNRKCFYLGLALLGAGFAIIAWLTYPENLLSGVM